MTNRMTFVSQQFMFSYIVTDRWSIIGWKFTTRWEPAVALLELLHFWQ